MRYHNVSFMSQSCLHFLFIQSLYSFFNLQKFFIYYYTRNNTPIAQCYGHCAAACSNQNPAACIYSNQNPAACSNHNPAACSNHNPAACSNQNPAACSNQNSAACSNQNPVNVELCKLGLLIWQVVVNDFLCNATCTSIYHTILALILHRTLHVIHHVIMR